MPYTFHTYDTYNIQTANLLDDIENTKISKQMHIKRPVRYIILQYIILFYSTKTIRSFCKNKHGTEKANYFMTLKMN